MQIRTTKYDKLAKPSLLCYLLVTAVAFAGEKEQHDIFPGLSNCPKGSGLDMRQQRKLYWCVPPHCG